MESSKFISKITFGICCKAYKISLTKSCSWCHEFNCIDECIKDKKIGICDGCKYAFNLKFEYPFLDHKEKSKDNGWWQCDCCGKSTEKSSECFCYGNQYIICLKCYIASHAILCSQCNNRRCVSTNYYDLCRYCMLDKILRTDYPKVLAKLIISYV